MIGLFTHLRSALGIAFNVPFTILVSLIVMTAGVANQPSVATRVMRFWAHVVLSIFGIHIRVVGEKNLPETGGGIIVFNHQSHLDIPSLMRATDKNIRFGAKIELFRIPFFGPAMRKVGTLPIARDNRNEVLKIYREAEARLKENTIFVLAPEGTRQKEPKLGRFKKGPFLFAINAQVPVFPAVIRGAHTVLPKNSYGINLGALSRTIDIELLPPFPTTGLTPNDVTSLMERVREAMHNAFDKTSENKNSLEDRAPAHSLIVGLDLNRGSQTDI